MNRIKLKGAYACINLDNIVHNYKEACSFAGPGVNVACVVKSDAYGHGEQQVVRALMEVGLKTICVSTMIEAIRLREAFDDIEILILGYTPGFLAPKATEYRIIQTISTVEEAEGLNESGPVKVHIKVNTGMNRLGFNIDQGHLIERVSQLPNIEIVGIFTHLHSSDSSDKTLAEGQYKKYCKLLNELEAKGVELGTRHVTNSGGIIDLPHMHEKMVREGIMLYGMYPSTHVNHKDIRLKEAMSYHTYIASLHDVKAGDGVSYGHTYHAPKDMTVATLNIGYSDGVFRHLSNKGEVIVGGERRPIVGRVCMNMIMVDVTGLDVSVEDDVVLFGSSGDQFISIDEVADWVGTISYEVTCRTGYSVPRVFMRHGQVIEVENDLLIVE